MLQNILSFGDININLQANKTLVIMAEDNITLNEAQMKMLDVVSLLDNAGDLDGLRQVVCNYLNQQLSDEMNRLWDEGKLNDQKVESFRTLHERTPYHKRSLHIG